MTTTTASLVDSVVALLTARMGASYPTSAGARVYAPRDWPTWDSQYPAAFVNAPIERKAGLGRNAPQFTVTSTIRIAVRASAPGAANDGSAGVVQAALWNIQRQIEVAIINAPTLMLPIQQIASVESQMAFNATGEKHLGELVMEFELEFFQATDDFFVIPGTLISEIAVSTPFQTPSGQNDGSDNTNLSN